MFSFSNNTRIPDASPKYYFSLTSVSVGVLFILRAQMPRTVYLKANIRVETCEKLNCTLYFSEFKHEQDFNKKIVEGTQGPF